METLFISEQSHSNSIRGFCFHKQILWEYYIQYFYLFFVPKKSKKNASFLPAG